MAVAGDGGQTTKEYAVIMENFSTIVTSLEQEGILGQVAMKVLEKNLIPAQRLRHYQNPDNASAFLLAMLGRIELDRSDFGVIMDCMAAIPTLSKLTGRLKAQVDPAESPEQSHDNGHSSNGHSSNGHSNGQQAPKLLGIDDLKAVLSEVKDAAADWDDLGLALGVLDRDLEVIRADHHGDSKKQLKETMKVWLKGRGGERSWKFLCQALRGDLVERPDIASVIEKKYNILNN